MKQLLFVAHSGKLGGPSSSLLKLVQYLPADYHPKIIVPAPGDYAELLHQQCVDTEVIDLRQRHLPGLALRSFQSALVYGNSVNYRVGVAMQAANMVRRRTIWHIREIMPDIDSVSPQETAYLQGIRQQMLSTHALIAVSKAAAEATERLLKGQRTPRVVYNGIDVDDFSLDRAAAREQILAQMKLPEDAVLIVQVGHLDMRKNPLEAIEAMGLIIQQTPQARLILLGDSQKDEAYVRQLQARIQALGLEDHVVFAGFQKNIKTFLCGADIQLHTALNDPHPRAILEGMTARLPVVAYATDGVAETVVTGETGYLVPQHDFPALSRCVVELIRNSESRLRMGQRSYERVSQHFQASATTQKIIAIIEEVLNS